MTKYRAKRQLDGVAMQPIEYEPIIKYFDTIIHVDETENLEEIMAPEDVATLSRWLKYLQLILQDFDELPQDDITNHIEGEKGVGVFVSPQDRFVNDPIFIYKIYILVKFSRNFCDETSRFTEQNKKAAEDMIKENILDQESSV